MATLNRKQPNAFAPTTTNRAGGAAYAQSAELELASLLLTSFFQGGDTYYEKAKDREDRLHRAISAVSPEFAAKAAVYARDVFGMRTSSHLVAVDLAAVPVGLFPQKAAFFQRVVQRPDDMLEIVAGVFAKQQKDNPKLTAGTGKLPNALKTGFRAVLERLDEYRLAKYRAEGKLVNMRDLVNLVHPKATPALTALMKGTLSAPETFEVGLSRAGAVELSEEETVGLTDAQKGELKQQRVAEAKSQTWADLVKKNPETGRRAIGYMALLKNLRNIATQSDPLTVAAACEALVDEKAIRSSRVLPFRFLTAYMELAKGVPKVPSTVLAAVSRALDIALGNVPQFPGRTLVVIDTSGSMKMCNPTGTDMTAAQLATAFGAAFIKANPGSDLMVFAESAKYVAVNTTDSVLSIAASIPVGGGGTNFNSIFNKAAGPYDRILILSDMPGWMANAHPSTNTGGAPVASAAAYRKKYSTNPWIYSWDLNGHGDMMFPESRVVCLAGWMGDKVFDLMSRIESGFDSIVGEIHKVQLTTAGN